MIHNESFSETLLKLLLYKTCSFKTVDELIRKHKDRRVSEKVLRNTLSRLKKKGLIERSSVGWSANRSAHSYLEKIRNTERFPKRNYHVNKNNDENNQMVVIYDIPEKMRRERDWLRGELNFLNFEQIQLSVWIGPSPLPEKFIKLLHKFKIIEFLRFFRVKKDDVV